MLRLRFEPTAGLSELPFVVVPLVAGKWSGFGLRAISGFSEIWTGSESAGKDLTELDFFFIKKAQDNLRFHYSER